MKAYLIVIIAKSKNTYDLRQAKVRIMDASDGLANRRVLDYDWHIVADAINKNKISLFGIKASITSVLGMEYFGTKIEDVIPIMKSANSICKKVAVLNIIYDKYGKHKVVSTTVHGTIDSKDISEFMNYYGDAVYNIKFKNNSTNIALPSIKTGVVDAVMCTYDGSEIMPIENAPSQYPLKNELYNGVAAPTINENRLFENELNLEAFKIECKSRGIKFELGDIEGGNLVYEGYDSLSKIVVAPSDASVKINRFSLVKNLDADTLIYPSEAACIEAEACENVPNIHNIVYKKPVKRFSGAFLAYLYSVNTMLSQNLSEVMPQGIEDIAKLFEQSDTTVRSKAFSLPNMSTYSKIDKCFNNISVVNNIVKIDNCEKINESFNNIGVKNFDIACAEVDNSFKLNGYANVVFGTSSNRAYCIIRQSFDIISNEVLDLSSITSLYISESFIDCPNLRKIIMPERSCNITSCFKNCPNLEEIVFSSRCSIFNSFDNALKIEEVPIQNDCGLVKSFSDNAKLIFEEAEIRNLTNIEPHGNQKIIIKDSVKRATTSAFNINFDMNCIEFENKSIIFGNYAFGGFKYKVLDMYSLDMPCLKDGAIGNCTSKTIILSKNTDTVKAGAFEGISSDFIMFPSSVNSIEARVFRGVKNRGITVIVVEGSYADSYFSRQKSVGVSRYKTEEEAYAYASGRALKSSSSEQKRAKLFLNSDDEVIRAIKDEEYIENIGLLYNYYKSCKPQTGLEKISLKLDKSKFEEYFDFTDLAEVFSSYCKFDEMSKRYMMEDISGDVTNKFIVISNFITRYYSKSSKSTMTIDNLSKLFDVVNKRSGRYTYANLYWVYSDTVGSIIQCKLRGLYSADDTLALSIIFIAIGEKVVFVASHYCDTEDGGGFHVENLGTTEIRSNNVSADGNNKGYRVGNIINVGDSIVFNLEENVKVRGRGKKAQYYAEKKYDSRYYIQSIKAPYVLINLIEKSIMPYIILLGKKEPNAEASTCVLCSFDDGTCYLGNCVSSKLTKNIYYNYHAISSVISKVTIIKKYNSISELDDEANEIIKRDVSGSADTYISSIINIDKIIAYNKNIPNAYDKDYRSLEWRLAKRWFNEGVKDFNTLPTKDIRLLLTSVFFAHVRKSIDSLEIADVATLDINESTKFVHGRVALKRNIASDMIGRTVKYVSFILTKGTSSKTIIDMYYSSLSIADIICKILNCYSYNLIGSSEYTMLNDFRYNPSEFGELVEISLGSYSVSLSVLKRTGEYFITHLNYDYESHSSHIVAVFKLKDADSVRHMCKLLGSNTDKGNRLLRSLAVTGARVGDPSVKEIDSTDIIRKAVIDGVPNDVRLSFMCDELEECIFRQPEKH